MKKITKPHDFTLIERVIIFLILPTGLVKELSVHNFVADHLALKICDATGNSGQSTTILMSKVAKVQQILNGHC